MPKNIPGLPTPPPDIPDDDRESEPGGFLTTPAPSEGEGEVTSPRRPPQSPQPQPPLTPEGPEAAADKSASGKAAAEGGESGGDSAPSTPKSGVPRPHMPSAGAILSQVSKIDVGVQTEQDAMTQELSESRRARWVALEIGAKSGPCDKKLPHSS